MPTVQVGLAAADNCRVAASGRCAAFELTFRQSRLVRGTSRAGRKVRQPKIRYACSDEASRVD
jgi:hypothetical protein